MRIFGKVIVNLETNIRLEWKFRLPRFIQLIGLFVRSDS